MNDLKPPTDKPAYGAETAEMVLNIINTFPELHNQATFESEDGESACGTQRCVAGWAYWVHHGALPYREDYSYSVPRTVLDGRKLERCAARYLGLDDGGSEWLFYSTSNEQATRALENIIAGRDVSAA